MIKIEPIESDESSASNISSSAGTSVIANKKKKHKRKNNVKLKDINSSAKVGRQSHRIEKLTQNMRKFNEETIDVAEVDEMDFSARECVAIPEMEYSPRLPKNRRVMVEGEDQVIYTDKSCESPVINANHVPAISTSCVWSSNMEDSPSISDISDRDSLVYERISRDKKPFVEGTREELVAMRDSIEDHLRLVPNQKRYIFKCTVEKSISPLVQAMWKCHRLIYNASDGKYTGIVACIKCHSCNVYRGLYGTSTLLSHMGKTSKGKPRCIAKRVSSTQIQEYISPQPIEKRHFTNEVSKEIKDAILVYVSKFPWAMESTYSNEFMRILTAASNVVKSGESSNCRNFCIPSPREIKQILPDATAEFTGEIIELVKNLKSTESKIVLNIDSQFDGEFTLVAQFLWWWNDLENCVNNRCIDIFALETLKCNILKEEDAMNFIQRRLNSYNLDLCTDFMTLIHTGNQVENTIPYFIARIGSVIKEKSHSIFRYDCTENFINHILATAIRATGEIGKNSPEYVCNLLDTIDKSQEFVEFLYKNFAGNSILDDFPPLIDVRRMDSTMHTISVALTNNWNVITELVCDSSVNESNGQILNDVFYSNLQVVTNLMQSSVNTILALREPMSLGKIGPMLELLTTFKGIENTCEWRGFNFYDVTFVRDEITKKIGEVMAIDNELAVNTAKCAKNSLCIGFHQRVASFLTPKFRDFATNGFPATSKGRNHFKNMLELQINRVQEKSRRNNRNEDTWEINEEMEIKPFLLNEIFKISGTEEDLVAETEIETYSCHNFTKKEKADSSAMNFWDVNENREKFPTLYELFKQIIIIPAVSRSVFDIVKRGEVAKLTHDHKMSLDKINSFLFLRVLEKNI